MSVGGRVQQLLDSQGHSYAEAAKISGVSRETIRRICLGHNPPKLRKYLREMAMGYRIDEFALLEGASPKGEFEWNIRQASAAQRLDWTLMRHAQRLKLTLCFLNRKYPNAVTVSNLAVACGLQEQAMVALLERWSIYPPDWKTALTLAQAIHTFTGISMSWFRSGLLDSECEITTRSLSGICGYVRMNQRASITQCVAALLRMVSPA